MVCSQTENPNLGKFRIALDWKMLIYFMTTCNISRTFEIFYDHMVHFVFIWYIFSGFGIMYQEKSGNPGQSTFVLATATLLRFYVCKFFANYCCSGFHRLLQGKVRILKCVSG
jgi:hypothetical protein